MNLIIRQEQQEDYPSVFDLIENAFKVEELSNHREQFLVERLRESEAFIPQLSLVAETDNTIVGHIILSKIYIKNDEGAFGSLALAPVSVLPAYQGKGIGSKLIIEAHKRARELGHESIVLLGHKTFYPRFGYKRADFYGITMPFEVPKENCMVIELINDGLKNVYGVVDYPKAFFG